MKLLLAISGLPKFVPSIIPHLKLSKTFFLHYPWPYFNLKSFSKIPCFYYKSVKLALSKIHSNNHHIRNKQHNEISLLFLYDFNCIISSW